MCIRDRYVPGGKAAYPSSVLMNVIPAKVAGVERIIMLTPPGADGKVNPGTLAAANIAGVDEIYKAGGAQAIAAMAFGTESIPKVDKITGPGNIFVALAKKACFGCLLYTSPFNGKALLEGYPGGQYVVQNPPSAPLSTEEKMCIRDRECG